MLANYSGATQKVFLTTRELVWETMLNTDILDLTLCYKHVSFR